MINDNAGWAIRKTEHGTDEAKCQGFRLATANKIVTLPGVTFFSTLFFVTVSAL